MSGHLFVRAVAISGVLVISQLSLAISEANAEPNWDAIAQCETLQDYVSRELLEDLLEHCEEAIDWLETQQTLIVDVTLPNYLQAHMEPGED